MSKEIKNSWIWLLKYFLLVLLFGGLIGGLVFHIDPYFHYHAPYTDRYFYYINSPRYQNNGIVKHFEYDAIITGTSMAENFNSSEFDELFGVNSVKTPFWGASYKEINDNVRVALENQGEVKLVLRCLDMNRFFDEKDAMTYAGSEYPTYLYNNNPFDDVGYLFNRNVVFGRCIPMVIRSYKGEKAGITSFDSYSNWMMYYSTQFGRANVLSEYENFEKPASVQAISEEEKKCIEENARANITDLCMEYPDTCFVFFFSPYSIVWWGTQYTAGNVERQIEAERIVIEEILKCENAELYSFNNRPEIIEDLDNYKDLLHYGSWINSDVLHYIHEGTGEIMKTSYEAYLNWELEYFKNYDYDSLVE